jgi:hypothetical protein
MACLFIIIVTKGTFDLLRALLTIYIIKALKKILFKLTFTKKLLLFLLLLLFYYFIFYAEEIYYFVILFHSCN